MATVEQVATASLKRILVQAEEAPLEPTDFQDFIFAMNNYMLALDAEGITLGYTVVDDLEDPVTVPVGALRGIIANMAIEVAPDYGGQVSQALVKVAKEGMDAMRRLGQRVQASAFPSTLPIGSGNEGGFSGSGSIFHFYPDEEARILAETTGAIGLEVSTNDVIVGET